MRKQLITFSLISILTTTLSPVAYSSTDITQGKEKASSCAGCHSLDGISLSDEFPNLAGQKKTYLVKQLKDFKSGKRQNPTMNAMTSTLSNKDINNLSAYFSSLSRIPFKKDHMQPAATAKATNIEFPKPTFISMKKSNTVESFPNQHVWNGGPNMLYTAVTPNGNKVLSTSPSDNTVYVFNAHNGKQLAIIPVGKAPKGVKITPNGQLAYISNQGSADISVVSLKTHKVINTIKTADGPHNVRFTRNGKIAYVTLQGGAGIGVIDTSKQKMTRIIPVPGITGPHNLDLSLDEKTAYVRDFVHHVAVLDLKTGKVKKVIKVGNGHGGIDVSPNGKVIATAAIGANFISVIDPNKLSVKNIKVGQGPHGIRSSEDSRWIYVTLTKDNSVAVIDTKTMKVHKNIATGEFPFWIAVVNNP